MLATAHAQSKPEVLRLWPDTAPEATANEPSDIPVIHLYRVESTEPTAGVVIFPGGGYGNLAMDHEGEQFAAWFNKMGMTAAICVYRHRGNGGNGGKGYGHPAPMLDAQRAIRTLKANASRWNLKADKIGIIGFSAGGHLASTVSTRHDGGDPTAKIRWNRLLAGPTLPFSLIQSFRSALSSRMVAAAQLAWRHAGPRTSGVAHQ